MADQELRLKLAELKLDQHEKLHAGTQEAIRVLTDGINELVQSAIRREHDDETFKRIFVELEKQKTELQAYKDEKLQAELSEYKNAVRKIIGTVALVVTSALATHFITNLLGG